jgi:NAD(P)H-dependent FMN reductase
LLRSQQVESHTLLLADLPLSLYAEGSYGEPSESFAQAVHNPLRTASHVVMVVPEYNGGFPGILKLFIDMLHPREWKGKKVALVGVATGRGGNLRGLDHLTGVLHYLGAEVLGKKVYLSQLDQHSAADGTITAEPYLKDLQGQAEALLRF